MDRWIARDARPQLQTLLIAVAVSIVLSFIPFADWLTYPFRIFVTFIHEGGHAVATLLTGGWVQRLAVSPDGSGLVYSASSSFLAQLFVSSAGYLGAIFFGALLLYLIRHSVNVHTVFYGIGGYILALTIFFGLSSLFTVIAGIALGVALIAVGRYAAPAFARFLLAFLAVQCVVGAIFDLRTLITLSAPFSHGPQTDAANMAAMTGLPAFIWAILWALLGLAVLFFALRSYITSNATIMEPPLRSRRYARLRP